MVRARPEIESDPEESAPRHAELGVSPSDDSLSGLARDAVGGKPEQVQRFLQAISPRIRRICRGVLGPGHPDLEDTIQECFLETLQALRSYRFEGTVLHYVTKIALRRSIRLRGRGSTRIRHLQLLAGHQDHDPIGAFGRESVEDAGAIRQLIARLRSNQAEALVLRIVLGFSVEEIASITGASVNTVKTRLRLAKNALRTHLSSQDANRRRDKDND